MKKFLSLVLALVMTMSLVTISAGAKDFTDADKVTYTEAVDVLSAVKVIDGYTDGAFKPTTQLNRGQAAKILCNMILGPTTASALKADAAPFKDVAADNTFAAYIAYCAKEGIIDGYTDGTFRPTAPLTGYAFMKLLLGALGYDKDVEGYNGANWSINVAKRALNLGLDDGLVADFDGTKIVTREEACLYALNTMKTTMVQYDTKTTVSVGGAEVVIAGSKAEDVWNNAANETIKNDDKMQFAEKYFTNLKLNASARDDFYRPANEWKVKADKVGTYPQTPDLTYTKGVESGDIYADLGSKIAKADVTVYIDGKLEATKSLAIAKGDETDVGVSGNGVLTEVYYDNDTETADIIQINTYVGEVDKTVKATDKKDAYIVIADTGVIATAPAANLTFETDEKFDDDTVVLYTYAKDAKEVKSVVAAEIVTGTVTRTENKKTDGEESKTVTIDGETYKAAAKFAGEEVGSITVKEDYDLYLDAYGYMIKVEKVSDLSSDYALVADYQTGSHNSIEGGFSARKALLVFADGTTKVVETAKNYAALEHKIVTYKADDDGVYTLREVQNTVAGAKVAGTKFVDDTTTFDLNNGESKIIVESGTPTTVYGNSNTVYVIYNNADDEWTAYTGAKNVPSVDLTNVISSKVDVYYYCKSGSMTTIMFIVPSHDAVVENNGSKVMFITKESVSNLIHDAEGDYYEYNAIVDGEIKTIKVDYSEGKGLNGFYNQYTTDKYGIYDNLVAGVGGSETFVGGAAQAGVSKTSADYTVSFKFLDPGYTYTYTVADNAAIYYVDEDGEITESSYNAISKDANDLVFAIVKDAQIKTLIIQEVDDDAVAGPVISAGSTVVNLGTGTVSILAYTGTTFTNMDDETALDLIYAELEKAGYKTFDTTYDNTDTYTIVAKKANGSTRTYTWTGFEGTAAVTEAVKISVDGTDMLVPKTATLDTIAGVKGTCAKGVDKDGNKINMAVMSGMTVADGAAYETGYYAISFTGSIQATATHAKPGEKIQVTVTNAGPWTGYIVTVSETGYTAANTVPVGTTGCTFDLTVPTTLDDDATLTLGYATAP